MNIYIGIDPGKNGGVAFLSHDLITTHKMPTTERDILDIFPPRVGETGVTAVAYIEKVSSSPQMGVVSAFTFGKGYGALLMALTAARIPFDEITPQKWQTAMGCRSGGDKNVTKRRAQQLFPGITVTHAIADAMLLAEYCRRIHER